MAKSGTKTRRKGGGKSRTKFRGTPRWKRDETQESSPIISCHAHGHQECQVDESGAPESSEPIPVSKNVFVECSDEDIVATTSASFRKLGNPLQTSKTTADATDGIQTRAQLHGSFGPEVVGYRIMDMGNLCDAMQEMHKCKGGKIAVKELNRSGLGSKLLFECSVCDHKVYMDTSRKTAGKVKTFDINRRTVFAAGELGLGREGVAMLCDIINLPNPLYDTAFQKHVKGIHNSTNTVLDNELRCSAQRLRDFHRKENPDMEQERVYCELWYRICPGS